MPTVSDLTQWLDRFAPFSTAESWDNVGLLLGDPRREVRRVMTCLTVTSHVVAEAIHERADAILSHHPILFRGAKSIRTDRHEHSSVWSLANHGISVLSPHTAFDNARDGINNLIATRIGLTDVAPLRATPANEMPAEYKIVVFVPEGDRESVLNAAFAAGAGRIGAYERCSFSTPGTGTFLGNEGANPTVGQVGVLESAPELRSEFVCPVSRLAAVLTAIRAAHSYEEPAIDVIPLARNRPGFEGSGRIGNLERTDTLDGFALRTAIKFKAAAVQVVGDPDRQIRRVAICCGAGDDFLPDARQLGADVLLTGEARFHRALEAESIGIGLVLLGHHASERPGVEHLAEQAGKAFPSVEIWASRFEADPIRTLMPETD